jgi:LAO/AO transport system kinase
VVAEIESMLSLASHEGLVPAIVKTVASEDRGVEGLLAAVDDYRGRADASGSLARRRRAHLRQQFEDSLRERLARHVFARVLGEDEVERTVDALCARSTDPFSAAAAVLRRLGMA